LIQNNDIEGEWTVVSSDSYKNTRRTVMKDPQLPIKTVNRYEALQNTEKESSVAQYSGLIKKWRNNS
jgi:thiamine biosynthesis protein ThiC